MYINDKKILYIPCMSCHHVSLIIIIYSITKWYSIRHESLQHWLVKASGIPKDNVEKVVSKSVAVDWWRWALADDGGEALLVRWFGGSEKENSANCVLRIIKLKKIEFIMKFVRDVVLLNGVSCLWYVILLIYVVLLPV